MKAKAISQGMSQSPDDDLRLGVLASHLRHESGAFGVNSFPSESSRRRFLGGLAISVHEIANAYGEVF